jgi:hypothetical protein
MRCKHTSDTIARVWSSTRATIQARLYRTNTQHKRTKAKVFKHALSSIKIDDWADIEEHPRLYGSIGRSLRHRKHENKSEYVHGSSQMPTPISLRNPHSNNEHEKTKDDA